VRLTVDNKIVCHHDKDTSRTTGQTKLISETTLQDLKSLECGSWLGEKWSNERIPELWEVIELLPIHMELFIEVKTRKEIVEKLLEEVQKAKDLEKITVISFYSEVIEAIKEKSKNIKCNLLVAFEYKDISTNEIIKQVKRIEADGVGVQNHHKFSYEMIQSLQEEGISAHVWTVDKGSEGEEYLTKGVDSITTNRPLYLRNYLEKLK
tara:strand:- start:3081 stop:3704 length:624 start_codon:yes stop_codon:yes gene_type:complete